MMAIGLTIIFGVMHIINMAHGDFLMLGMYISFWTYLFWKISPFISVALAFFLVLAVGAIIYHFVVSRIEGQAAENSLLLTAGISFIIVSLARYLFTPDYRRVSYLLSNQAWYWGDVSINKHAFWAFVAALALTLLLALFLKYSRPGSAIRATAQNRESAALVGVDISRNGMLTFGLGAALAAAAGALLSPMVFFHPQVGISYIIKSFIVVVLGGMGSIPGALIGGLILGITEQMGAVYISSGYTDAFGLLIFIFVLLFKPSGIMGR